MPSRFRTFAVSSFFFYVFFFASACLAQDFRKQKGVTYEKWGLPVEQVYADQHDLNAIFGINLQVGGSYGLIQDSTVFPNSSTGGGFAVNLAFGWDMTGHPISIELETGFQRKLLGTTNAYSEIPLKFSTFYLSKLSKDSLLRLGVGSSLDLRIVNSEWAILPTWHISMIYEINSFTFEPALEIKRLRAGNNFVVGAFYFGYRI